jgi:hypothetical protein
MTQNTVNPVLTANPPERPVIENDTYAAFVRRVVRAQGRRVAAGDVDGLVDLLTLAQEVEAAIDAAVAGLRRAGYSWAEIATRVGVTRQAAQQRWGGEQ